MKRLLAVLLLCCVSVTMSAGSTRVVIRRARTAGTTTTTTSTTTTLCTQDVGTDKGCCFSGASVSVPAYSCLGLVATKSGTVSTAPVDGNWTVTCTP